MIGVYGINLVSSETQSFFPKGKDPRPTES